MKKTYVHPEIIVQGMGGIDIICTSLDGVADPNKPTLSKYSSFYWDDEDFEE